jgi:hypothetical protein
VRRLHPEDRDRRKLVLAADAAETRGIGAARVEKKEQARLVLAEGEMRGNGDDDEEGCKPESDPEIARNSGGG